MAELRRIIRRIERGRPRRLAPEPVAPAVGGEILETAEGSVVRVRQTFPWSHRHGRYPLGRGSDPWADALAVLSPRASPVPGERGLLFLDAETTGLAGGTGTYAFLVGIGWMEPEAVVLEQYFMRDFDEEPALLAALAPRLTQAAAVVTFNGASFDLPLLETRFVLGRRRWPDLTHVDLLAPARRVWLTALGDCRLSTLERGVLGVARVDDVAGWEIPSRFFAYLRDRQPGRLRPLFAHNRDDVLSLISLLGWFAQTLAGEATRLSAEELAGLGRLCERIDAARSAAYYRAALDAGVAGPSAHWVRLRLAWWEKRQARWEAACALWQAATEAEGFDPRPWEELAKFHEHRRRDATAAHELVQAALHLARSARASSGVVEAFTRRRDRLQRRLAGGRAVGTGLRPQPDERAGSSIGNATTSTPWTSGRTRVPGA